MRFLLAFSHYLLFCGASFRLLFTKKWPQRILWQHLFAMSVASLPLVAITGCATGAILAAQSFFQLADKGLASATGILVGKSLASELGPVLTAFMITGRVGGAMCAELAAMRVSEQIDALESMSVDPLCYLVIPRWLAALIALPVLTVLNNLIGMVGGMGTALILFDMPMHTFWDPMINNLTNLDLWSGIIKAIWFGHLIATIGCFLGLETRGGAAQVGARTTQAVVWSYSTILLSNFVLTVALHQLWGG